MRRFLLLCQFVLVCSCLGAEKTSTGFDFAKDTFGFQNETFFTYDANQRATLHRGRTEKGGYSRQCFTMARATLQFFKFARFDPKASKVSSEELAKRVRAVCRVPAWASPLPLEKRIIFPGYASLREFSTVEREVVQKNMGIWWAGYFRFSNYRMPLPTLRAGQAKAARIIEKTLRCGNLQVVYMMRFAWLNHNIVLYEGKKLPDGDFEFLAYDPNLNDRPRVLRFRAAQSGFEFPQTFYFRGGPVNVFRTYISPFH